jgi:hypothetical protein
MDTSNFCEEFVAMQLPRSLSEDSIMSHSCASVSGTAAAAAAAAAAGAATAGINGGGLQRAVKDPRKVSADAATAATTAATTAAGVAGTSAATQAVAVPAVAADKNSKECKYVAPNGMFRGFSFVADRFDFDSGSWLPLSEGEEGGDGDDPGCKQVYKYMYIPICMYLHIYICNCMCIDVTIIMCEASLIMQVYFR